MSPENDKIAHFFHRPAFRGYQKSLIQAISLPVGARGQFLYGKVWVNESFKNEIENINSSNGYPGLIWALSCLERQEGDRIELEFSFACPIRYVEILNIEEDDDNYFVNFRAGKYISDFEKKNINEIATFSHIGFDGNEIPYPGSERGFVYVSPMLEINSTETFSFQSLYSILKDIPSGTTSAGKEREIRSYPLIKLEDIKGCNANEMGTYKLKKDEYYTIPYSIYQGDKYRSRSIIINKKQESGKIIKGKMLEKIMEGQDQINFEVEINDIIIHVPLHIEVKIPIYKKKFAPVAILGLVSLIGYLVVPGLLPSGISDSNIALLSALIILNLAKLSETISK